MSQAGKLTDDGIGPYSFVTDDGTAAPVTDIVRIFGGVNVQTEGSGSVITVNAVSEVTSKSAAYTATEDDYFINCTANSFTIDLPAASGLTGKMYEIKNSGTGTIVIDGNGTETIDGELTQSIYQDESVTLICDGSNWYIV